MARGKAPGAIDEHSDAETITLGVADVFNAVFPGADVLIPVAPDADVGIVGTLHLGCVERHVR